MTNVPTTPVNLAEPANISWGQRLRRLIEPAVAPDSESVATGVVNVQVWMDQAIWRPAGFWAFAAGLLAAGVLRRPGDLNWQALALLALLVDPLWGSIWRLAGGRRALLTLPPLSSDRRIALPYLQTGSPAARLLAGDHTDVWPSALRVGVPAVIVALLVSALLGTYAVGMTLLVVVLAALGWTLRRTFGHGVPLLQSIVAIGLPWALTLQQVQHGQGPLNWLPQLVLIGCWVLHQWGGLRNSAGSDWLGLAGLAVAEVALCILLIAAQAPLWLAPLVILMLPTWLLAYQRLPLRRLRAVWLAAMLISAIALGQTVGL
jgi:hypothetical protein